MKIIHSAISKNSIYAILRTAFLMYMSVYISVGHLIQSMDYFEPIEIELLDETESSEKEVKENLGKEDFLSALFIRNFSFHTKLYSFYFNFRNWKPCDQDILTPPPES